MSEKDTILKSLNDLYIELGLSVDMLDPKAGIAIVNLNDVGFELPYKSPSYRPNYFSFLFVKKVQANIPLTIEPLLPNRVLFISPIQVITELLNGKRSRKFISSALMRPSSKKMFIRRYLMNFY